MLRIQGLHTCDYYLLWRRHLLSVKAFLLYFVVFLTKCLLTRLDSVEINETKQVHRSVSGAINCGNPYKEVASSTINCSCSILIDFQTRRCVAVKEPSVDFTGRWPYNKSEIAMQPLCLWLGRPAAAVLTSSQRRQHNKVGFMWIHQPLSHKPAPLSLTDRRLTLWSNNRKWEVNWNYTL